MVKRWTFRKSLLSKLPKVVLIHLNYIMEGVRSLFPEIQGCYLKNIFPNILSNTSSDFVSDMGVTYHIHYDRSYRE